jgi:nickel-dependent lactate racemase
MDCGSSTCHATIRSAGKKTLKVHLLYGKRARVVEFPSNLTTVISPKPVTPVPDEIDAVRQALRRPIGTPPLRELVSSDDSVAIVFSDITRPVPNKRILPILLGELNHLTDGQIVFVNALGTHRPNTPAELVEMIGPEIPGRFRIIQHDCYNRRNLVHLGNSSRGNEIWVNRTYMESTVRILTGLIEPHLFAGFSGGPKAVLPGVAGAETIFSNHGAHMIGHHGAGFARTAGNPIWQEMLEVAAKTDPAFLLNVTLTDDRRIAGVFAGDLQQAHQAGVEFLRRTAMIPVDGMYDIVVSTAGGYPSDISMYQSVKGIAVAANIVKDGGSILLVSECQEGLPDYGAYGDTMCMADSPEELLAMIRRPGFSMQDQWDAQIQAQVCSRVKLHIYSEGLTEGEIEQVFGMPCRDVEHAVETLIGEHGPQARIAVLPTGPHVVPYVDGSYAANGEPQ